MLKAVPAIRSDQVTRGFVLLTLESLQEWRVHKLFELLTPA